MEQFSRKFEVVMRCKFMGHFLGQNWSLGQKSGPNSVRENNTSRKNRNFWDKKVVRQKFLSHAQTVAAQGFQGFLGQKTSFILNFILKIVKYI